MKSLLKIVILSAIISSTFDTAAQLQLRPLQASVYGSDQLLQYPFAGGLNSGQYQAMDLDGNGDEDLVIFDRSAERITCFENQSDHYEYQPAFEALFPSGLKNWIVLADYNCDGLMDLFASAQLGIKVYENIGEPGSPAWDLVADPLLTLSGGSEINVFLNATDIPSIVDLDGDDDLDILVFNFSTGTDIEFHRNVTTNCGLAYEKVTETYGGINVCDCSDYVFDESCSASGRLKHLAGKALLSFDYNEDGLMDLVISEEDCAELNYLENKGSQLAASFDSWDTSFPTFGTPIDFTLFPAAYSIDVTFDGISDLVIAPNMRDNNGMTIDMKASSFFYPNLGNQNYGAAQNFLQDEMIDVGEWAYPVMIDVNGDGREDLLIGNRGSLRATDFVSSLTLYIQQMDGSFTLETEDAFSLSELGHLEIKPQIVDMNGDGRPDLVFSSINESFSNRMYYLPNQSETGLEVDYNQLRNIDLSYGSGDDVYLYDMDQDGHLDALIGRSYGELDYLRFTGSVFVMEERNILQEENSSGRLSLVVADIDEDGKDDLLTTDATGNATLYSNIRSNRSQSTSVQIICDEVTSAPRFGRASRPAFGRVAGQATLMVGSIQGGVWAYEIGEVEKQKLMLLVYPNPSLDDQQVTFLSNQRGSLYLLTASGHLVLKDIPLDANTATEMDFSFLKPGLYIAYIRNGKNTSSQKLVLR
ncbi:T9SS type A sorting domain-containing protein [Reichenbachiella ulvae]|uniref:T9SS type A sorting domain-containing protein n=1 Tax=Reichenbachiella ulvae TaxID=2980104 RepID=A0ABT3CX17_9BACT|nr:T9SS type A sorting domain-containing protein [Reichenbachiella ulvae]MCV9388103.1 T9SS type A sorting domain-containing protein [Reichenbachiella ulvae]